MRFSREAGTVVLIVGMVVRPASARADIDDDCVDANNKSIALRRAGKLLDARAETTKCATATCGQELQSSCLRRTDEINAALPSIVFDVRDDGGTDIGGVNVVVDGKATIDATVAAISLDPGEHKFVFESIGWSRVERTFILREGERQRRERILLMRLKEDATLSPAAETGPVAEPSRGKTQRIVGLSVAGLGALGVGLGAVFGLSASSKWSDAQTQCGAGCPSDSAAQGLKSDASSAATLSTLSFIAGATLMAGGLALFFTATSADAAAPTTARPLRLAPTGGLRGTGLSLVGDF